MEEHIEETKKDYTEKQKIKVYNEVNLVNDSIKFLITTIGKDMTNFKDVIGQSLLQLDTTALEKNI